MEEVGSQTVTTTQDEQAISDAMTAFGLDTPSESQESSERPQDTLETEQSETPAKEDAEPARTIKVKVDKEEREFDASDDKLPEYIQKAYALDKERERKSELQKNLDRAAKLAGFEKADDYIANLDKIEAQQKQQQQDAHNQLLAELREQAEEVGLDADKLEEYLSNHPLVKAGEKATQEREQFERNLAVQSTQEVVKTKWSELYKDYPELVETSKAFEDGSTPDWFTPEMQSRIERGYDPKDAYELAHKGSIIERNKKLTEQRTIKEQRLGARSQVSGHESSDAEPEVSPEIASAFAMFGLDPKSAKKYMK